MPSRQMPFLRNIQGNPFILSHGFEPLVWWSVRPVIIVQQVKDKNNQEFGDKAGRRVLVTDLRVILDISGGEGKHTSAYRNFSDMSVHRACPVSAGLVD